MITASLLSGLLSSFTFSAQPASQPSSQAAPAQTVPQATSQPPPAMSQEAWRATMWRTPMPKKGCFTASYPSTEWREVPCTTAPPYPRVPRLPPRARIVGNGTDWVATRAGTGTISSAIGSFDSVTGVTSVSSRIGNTGPEVANAYDLQLNTDMFPSTACAGSPNPLCQGFQQFVFGNDGTSGVIFIQYWLIQYNTTCPTVAPPPPAEPWRQFSFSGSTDIYCVRNSRAPAVPNQPITNLGQLSLRGTVGADGDSVTLSTGSTVVGMLTGDNSVNAAAGWRSAEFNVFGSGGNQSGGSQANFNSGSTIVVRTSLNAGTEMAPTCTQQGFTAETNNLNLVGTPIVAMMEDLPAIVFTESNDPSVMTPPSCGGTTGEPHLMTFDGLFYDFQASGDFLLVQADRFDFPPVTAAPQDFVVQTRQVSRAPRWPNISANEAVATRIGGNHVAVCLPPMGLVINGDPEQLDDGESLSLPSGVSVTRTGNAYVIERQSGDIVRAEVNDGWINVSVGVAPESQVRGGLLGNANGDTGDDIAIFDGPVLAQPVSFADLYDRYGDSWRVPFDDSLLSVCGDGEIEPGNPQEPFYANDLNPDQYRRARQICMEAGVEDQALLDACILDVTVLGTETAATVFARMPTPIAVMQAGSRPPIEVAIDIEPGEFPNLIHISNDPNRIEVTTVAILTTPTFDAATVDPSTVRFGKTGTEAAPVQATLADVNGDGTLDLVLRFRTKDTGLQCGDTSALLTGMTVSGEVIQGSDSIVTVRGGVICP